MLAGSAAQPLQPRYAGFLIRTVAYLIDAFLLSLVGGAFPYLLIAGTPNSQQPNSGAVAPSAGSSVLLAAVYFVLFWSVLGGRTIGMWITGLRVIRDDGEPLDLLGAIARVIGLWLSFALCFVGVIWVAFDSRHRGWHDMLARTLVIHV